MLKKRLYLENKVHTRVVYICTPSLKEESILDGILQKTWLRFFLEFRSPIPGSRDGAVDQSTRFPWILTGFNFPTCVMCRLNWATVWFSSLLREVFLLILRFSPLAPQNPTFPNSNSIWSVSPADRFSVLNWHWHSHLNLPIYLLIFLCAQYVLNK